MTANVFLGVLIAVFALNTLIHLPFGDAIDVSVVGMDNLRSDKRWYVLEAESYAVDGMFDNVAIRSSIIPTYSHKVAFFHVTVIQDNGNTFGLAVRVRGDKRRILESGESVRLYGMMSELKRDVMEKQSSLYKDSASQICLNDNGSTVFLRFAAMMVSLLATVGLILILLFINRRTSG